MTSAPTYKPSESKREEFRKYLEKTGVMDALTKVLVSLYEEPDKPEDAIDYIINKLCSQAGYETLESLKYQLEMANAKLASLESEHLPPPEVISELAAEPAEGGEGEEPSLPPETTSETAATPVAAAEAAE